MELAQGGSLLDYVRQRKRLAEPEACFFLQQIVHGLMHCHDMEVQCSHSLLLFCFFNCMHVSAILVGYCVAQHTVSLHILTAYPSACKACIVPYCVMMC